MINKYSLKKDGQKKLSANFTVAEFKCNDGSDTVLISSELVALLQKIRNHFGKPLTINSAYRSPSYNKKIGGVSNSQHTCGTACDIAIKGITPEKIAQYAEYIMHNSGGIGLYSSFTHVDVRVKRSRWKNNGKEIVVSGFPGYNEKKEIKTATEAIAILHTKGIINTPDKWYNGTWNDADFKTLLVKISKHISGQSIGDAVSAIAALNKSGIINSPDVWYKGTWTDENFKQLLIKVANYILNKGA